MIVLGIETSCDDTGAAILEGDTLLSNVISTQLVHQDFGGVVPELASRQHVRNLIPVISEAFRRAGKSRHDIEGIAVTYGPGLAGSLMVGLSMAKGLALSLNIPFVGINHLEGHIWANRLAMPGLNPPFIVLIASGGHTQIVHVRDWGMYEVMGRTRDDASGEAFDKVAKFLGLGYPGGPYIERAAAEGNPDWIRFPRARLEKESFDFSFSGLKTAVISAVRQKDEAELKNHLPDLCASFQQAVIDILIEKSVAAAASRGVKTICLAGGVAVNRRLQELMKSACDSQGIQAVWPEKALCTDNGAMIARAGAHYLGLGRTDAFDLAPDPSLNL